MRRREVIAAVLATATLGAWPLAPRAQTGIKRLGVVYQGGPYEPSIEGLREGLKAAGLEEGRDIALLLRNVRGDVAAAEATARALERDEKADVIVAIGTTTARAAQRATVKVPIMFAGGTDPVAAGLVESIAKARRKADRLLLPVRRSHGETARNPARDRAEASPDHHVLRPAHSGRPLRASRRSARQPGSWTLRSWRNRSPPSKSCATVCAP